MKVSLEDNKIIIFLNTLYFTNINIRDKKELQKFLGKIIKKLKYIYNLDVDGFLNTTVYFDKFYGVVLVIEREKIEYFDYFDSIEISFKVIETSFLYKLEELLDKKVLKKFNVYKDKDNLYLQIKNKLSFREMAILLENTKLIYKTDKMLKINNLIGGEDG